MWILLQILAIVAVSGSASPARIVDARAIPGADLPLPDPIPQAVIGPTLNSSISRWPQKLPWIGKHAPNILLIMNDDSGFGHPDTFGGPVHTPSLTRVAKMGISYNRFHNAAICSPTRASLLTGRNPHNVGSGQITELASGFPGYTGRIPKSAATIAKILSEYGYDTGAFGKWHNTPVTDLTRQGPFDQYPTGLGFRYFYGFLAGETSQYEPRLFENTNPIEPPKTPEQGYHLTEDLADQAVKFIRDNRALNPDRPFFMYFAPGGTHGPHHVNKEWADKYKGKFDMGWETLRNITFQKQKAMGWIPDSAKLTEIDPTMTRWEDVPERHKAFQTRLMEVYAGFLEHTDTQHGRILDELENQRITNNTFIIYVYADNGASAEGYHGTLEELLTQNRIDATVDDQIEFLEREFGGLDALGGKHLANMYHSSWAWAGDTPFKSTKLVAAHFGGTRTPLVMAWPKVIKHDTVPRTQFHHVSDIAPTILEAVGIAPPRSVDGVAQQPHDGLPMLYSFNASAAGQKNMQIFEVFGGRAIYKDGWFAGTMGPRIPWAPNATRMNMWDPNADEWELYNLEEDYTQANNLAEAMPEKVEEMKSMFLVQAAMEKVLPIGAGLYTFFYHPEEAPHSPLREWTLYEGQTRIAESNAPLFRTGHSSLSNIEVEIKPRASGVIFCVGGLSGGFSLYMDDGYLYASYYATLMFPYHVKSEQRIQAGSTAIQMQFLAVPKTRSALVILAVNGNVVGRGRIDQTCPIILDASETFDVGMDLGSPVSRLYEDRLPFAFNGKIKKLNIKYIDNGRAEQQLQRLLI